MTFQHIGILGAGAWGTALAVAVRKAGNSVTIWAREPEVSADLDAGRGNPKYLPNVDIPAMPASSDLAVMADCDAILAVVPAQFTRSTLDALSEHIRPDLPIALCSKGVEQSTLKLMGQVLAETLPEAQAAVLSGPSFAIDVSKGLPTAVTLACADRALGAKWMESIGRPEFRPYWSDDIVGAEVGGAVKNVLAIACGAVEGLGLGKSAHAALISRGFAEMVRLGLALGARQDTLAGLCGLGDLVLTCSSPQSRNMSFGFALGQGRAAADILAERQSVTEGVATAPAVVALARANGVEMPICEAVANVLSGHVTLGEAMTGLLERPFKAERVT